MQICPWQLLSAVTALLHTAVSHWMSANHLKLNTDKREWLWTGTKSNLDRLTKSALHLILGNAADLRQVTLLVLLDMSAAFDCAFFYRDCSMGSAS